LAHSRSFLAKQKARNAILGAENLLKGDIAVIILANGTLGAIPNGFAKKKGLW